MPGAKWSPESRARKSLQMKESFPITTRQRQFIVSQAAAGVTPGGIYLRMREKFNRSPRLSRIIEVAREAGVEPVPSRPRRKKGDQHHGLTPELYSRIVRLLDQGFSAYVVGVQLRGLVSMTRVVRIRDRVNAEREAAGLQPLRPNKSLKGAFISNALSSNPLPPN